MNKQYTEKSTIASSTKDGVIIINISGYNKRTPQEYASAILNYISNLDTHGKYELISVGSKLFISRSEGDFSAVTPTIFLRINPNRLKNPSDPIEIKCEEGFISQSDLESIVQ